MFASDPVTHPCTMSLNISLMPSTAKLKCAQLQLPSASPTVSQTKSESSSVSRCFRSLFEDNLDRLKEYIAITSHYKCRVKSFSTSDIFGQVNCESEPTHVKYLSDCDLAMYNRHHSSREMGNDYVTYSCSTLAICGDTIHSSQLPSPQTQSIKQINAFIFSDLDLIKSITKKVRNAYINKRVAEFLKSINVSSLCESEVETISKLSSDLMMKPIRMRDTFENNQQFIDDSGDILIRVVDYESEREKINNVRKQDKNTLVLNWLQTVEACPVDQEIP